MWTVGYSQGIWVGYLYGYMGYKGPMTREGTCQSLHSRALSLDVDLKRTDFIFTYFVQKRLSWVGLRWEFIACTRCRILMPKVEVPMPDANKWSVFWLIPQNKRSINIFLMCWNYHNLQQKLFQIVLNWSGENTTIHFHQAMTRQHLNQCSLSFTMPYGIIRSK